MKVQDSVFTSDNNVNFSPSVSDFLKGDADTLEESSIRGGLLSDAKQAWLSCGSRLCVVDVKSGYKVAAWTFGSQLSNFTTEILYVKELSQPLLEGTKQLIVSLECSVIGGMICIVHCSGSLVLRCIQTNSIITHINDNECIRDGPFACFDGIIIAGTQNGGIVVFDLNRRGCTQAIKNINQGYENLVRDENNMSKLAFLSLDNLDYIEEQREIALETEDHIGVHVNETSYEDENFTFFNPDGTVRLRAKRDHVYVSSLLYVQKLASVIVGYNFGAFQIWNLIGTMLEYTSPVNVECNPVTHLGFQEPCDDPRAFCYLWVIYSRTDKSEETGFPIAVMHSITYQGKAMINDIQYIYQDFITCTVRLQLELTSSESVMSRCDMIGGRIMSCHTHSIHSNKMTGDGDEGTLNLCQMVWECWGQEGTFYGMVLFDLDQWYKDQMPGMATTKCSNTFMSCTHWKDSPDLLDILLYDVVIYSGNARRLEEHYYPNSLSVHCAKLCCGSVGTIKGIGLQRTALDALHNAGPAGLLVPQTLYSMCFGAGLIPLYSSLSVGEHHSLPEQREFLLSVALEARLVQFLERCIIDWSTGTHSSAGCSILFLVEWCWKQALVLKRNGTELTAPLFDHSGIVPDKNTIKCLENCMRQLVLLGTLLEKVVTKCCSLIIPDLLKDIEQRSSAIKMVATYFQVVQWFLDVGLLPEYSMEDEHTAIQNDILPYPYTTLATFYEKRRIKLHCLDGNNTSDKSKLKQTSCTMLYIDQLIENECGGDQLKRLWSKDSNGVYPPTSLHSLLKIYLLPGVRDVNRHSLLLYLLLDYSTVFSEDRYSGIIRKLMQFPSMFGLSNTAIKATQAFWHLDRRNFEFAMDQLQSLSGDTLSPWQHSVVMTSLLAQNKTQPALHYLHVRSTKLNNNNIDVRAKCHNDKKEDWRSYCDLYLARRMCYEAFDIVRTYIESIGDDNQKRQVLLYFLKGMRKERQLSKMLEMPLSEFEEEVFIDYLKSSSETELADLLVLFYLHSGRYIEAQQYNNTLKESSRSTIRSEVNRGSAESLLQQNDRREVREIMVNILCDSMPHIAGKVARTYNKNVDTNINVVVPKPMSVFLQSKSPKNLVYKSSFIQKSIQHASEIWSEDSKISHGIKRALDVQETPFICTPRLKRDNKRFNKSQNKTDMSIDECEPSSPKRSRLDSTTQSMKDTTVIQSTIIEQHKTPENVKYEESLREKLNEDMKSLLELPDVEVTPWRCKSRDRSSIREATPHSILKRQTLDRGRTESPVEQKYSSEKFESSSHHSDAQKQLRFDIPSNSDSTPSSEENETSLNRSSVIIESIEDNEEQVPSPVSVRSSMDKDISQRNYKDSVKGRLSVSATSSLNNSNDDFYYSPSESIADWRGSPVKQHDETLQEGAKLHATNTRMETSGDESVESSPILRMVPSKRRSIRSSSIAKAPSQSPINSLLRNDSPELSCDRYKTRTKRLRTPEPSSVADLNEPTSRTRLLKTPEPFSEDKSETIIPPRLVTPDVVMTPPSPVTRSMRSRTPDIKIDSPRMSRGRSKTPELSQVEKPHPSPRRTRLRSKTPEVSHSEETDVSPMKMNLRSRSKTPDSLDSTKRLSIIDKPRGRKSLTRIVLEANTFSNVVNKSQTADISLNTTAALTDLGLSPMINKTILTDPDSSVLDETSTPISKEDITYSRIINMSMESPLSETMAVGKSILQDNDSIVESSDISIKDISQGSDVLESRTASPSTTKLLRMEIEFDESYTSFNAEVTPDSSEPSEDVQEGSVLQEKESSSDTFVSGCDNQVPVVDEIIIEEVEPLSEGNTSSDVDCQVIHSDESASESCPKDDTTSNLREDFKIVNIEEVETNEDNGEAMKDSEDPLNEANCSIVTEDESVLTSDSSDLKLNYTIEEVDEIDKNSSETVGKEIEEVECTKEKNSEGDKKIRPPSPKKLRTRTRSTSSNKSVTQANDEIDGTSRPSRRSERKKSCDSVISISSRVSTRSQTKSVDKEVIEQNKPEPIRRQRRSILLQNKPELDVIPEISIENSMMKTQDGDSATMNQYSSTRRLTRRQKNLLQKSMPTTGIAGLRGRSSSVASRTESEYSVDSDDESKRSESFDPISLLDKNDFEDERDVDAEVISLGSKSSLVSDSTKMPRAARVTRSNSDTSSLRDVKKPTRRLSTDLVSELDSPRTRRSSFNKAVEALSTPQKRRLSTDTASPLSTVKESEMETTPKRRTRRAASIQRDSVEERTVAQTKRRTKASSII